MKGTLIGAFRNDWRMRRVSIFEDIKNPEMVYTVGMPFGPGADPLPHGDGPKPIETHELRADFAHYIGTFNKVYK